jgi:Uma2 family endonuclease
MRRREGAGTMTEQKPRATYKDLLEVPDIMVAEILDGELYASPRPAMRHSQAASELGGQLWGPFRRGRGGPGGWWILDEPELHLGEDVLVPDLAAWRRDRLPQIPDTAAISLAPDWICEVISPSTEQIDRVRKLPIYAREGVGHAWLINPQTKTLEVFRRAENGWVLLSTHGGNEAVRAEPFEAVAIELAELWGDA